MCVFCSLLSGVLSRVHAVIPHIRPDEAAQTHLMRHKRSFNAVMIFTSVYIIMPARGGMKPASDREITPYICVADWSPGMLECGGVCLSLYCSHTSDQHMHASHCKQHSGWEINGFGNVIWLVYRGWKMETLEKWSRDIMVPHQLDKKEQNKQNGEICFKPAFLEIRIVSLKCL